VRCMCWWAGWCVVQAGTIHPHNHNYSHKHARAHDRDQPQSRLRKTQRRCVGPVVSLSHMAAERALPAATYQFQRVERAVSAVNGGRVSTAASS
jgi:hypothetical protein